MYSVTDEFLATSGSHKSLNTHLLVGSGLTALIPLISVLCSAKINTTFYPLTREISRVMIDHYGVHKIRFLICNEI